MEKDIDKIVGQIEAQTQNRDRLKEIIDSDEEFEKSWGNLSDRQKRRHENKENYEKFLFKTCDESSEQLQRLEEEKKQLRTEKESLRKKEERLGEERIDLRRKLEQIEASQENDKRLSGKFGKIELKPLDDLKIQFDSKLSPYAIKNWDFDFVKVTEMEDIVKLITNTLNIFKNKPSQDTDFGFPVVDGASGSGSGKSRLCWEVGKYFVENHDAQFVFIDCDTTDYEYESETNADYFTQSLANILFRRFTLREYFGKYDFTLTKFWRKLKTILVPLS